MASKRYLVVGNPGEYTLREIDFRDVENGVISRQDWASGASAESAAANRDHLNQQYNQGNQNVQEEEIKASPEQDSRHIDDRPEVLKKTNVREAEEEIPVTPYTSPGYGFDFDPYRTPEETIKEAQDAVAAGEQASFDKPQHTLEDLGLEKEKPGAPLIPRQNYDPPPVVDLVPINKGGRWIAVENFPGVVGLAYFHEYDLPGGYTVSYFASREDLNKIVGPGKDPTDIYATVDYNVYRSREGGVFAGNISDVTGNTQHYDTRIARTLLTPTGETSLPNWANDSDEIQGLFYVSIAENWTETRFLKEIAVTDSFQQRFPAFQEMLGVTGNNYTEALENYKSYEAQVKQLNRKYGEEADVKGLVEQAIKKGYTVEDIGATYDIFERAESNADALLAFQGVLDKEGLNFNVLSSEGIVKFFEGSAPTQIYDIYEASSIAEQVNRLDLDAEVDYEQALQIAKDTPGQLTQQQISAGLQSAAQTIAKFRQYIDLGYYGLTSDDIINLSLGYREPGGKTEVELATAISRIINVDENFQNLASGVVGSKVFRQKQRQIRSV